MGAGLIIGLVQAALGAFAPLAQQKIQAEIGRHTDQATAGQVAQSVMDAIQQATGKPDPIQAVAAITAKDAPQAMVQAAQDDALARLDKVAPLFDKIAAYDKQQAELELAARDAAAARGQKDKVDISPFLARSSTYIVGLSTLVLLGGIIAALFIDADGKASIALVGLGGPLLQRAFSNLSEVFAYRYGGTSTGNAAEAARSAISKS